MNEKELSTYDQEWRTPACDILESKENFEILLDMPSVDEKNLDITFQNGTLCIIGHANISDHANMHCARNEYHQGDFKREFSLSEQNIAVDTIKAELKNGILKLTLPKSEKVKPRKIEVKNIE